MMKDKKMDEYRKAFNEGGAVESSTEDMNVADNETTEAAPEGIAETPAVAVVIAEGAPAGKMPADAEDKAEMSPQDMQRAKSWEGRIKKREAELAAREAELAAREAALNGDVQMRADGGYIYDETVDPMEVARARMAERDAEYEAKYGKPAVDQEEAPVAKPAAKPAAKKPAAQAEAKPQPKAEPKPEPKVEPVEDAPMRAMPEPTESRFDDMRREPRIERNAQSRPRAESLFGDDEDGMGDMTNVSYDDMSRAPRRYAEGGEVEGVDGEMMADEGMTDDMGAESDDPVEQMAADYGPEIVAAVTAIVERTVRKIVEEMGGAFASEVEGKIAEIMRATNEGFGMIQGEMLRSVVDDIDDVLESDEFTAWVQSLPEEEKAQAQQVIDAGTPSQGIKLIRQYKARSKGPSPEDVWAEDAAVAVKGKSPVRLPDRPSMSPEDEYRAAFNAA